jgi:hypothetical protein
LRRGGGRGWNGGRGRARDPQNLRLNAHRPRNQGSELEWRFAFCLINLHLRQIPLWHADGWSRTLDCGKVE